MPFMKFVLLQLTFLFTSAHLTGTASNPVSETIAAGQQPEVFVNKKGEVRIAFGRSDSIFCVTSIDMGISFTEPEFVGKVVEMHLGMTRGPQIASSSNFSLITAIDKRGNIHTFF